METPITLKPTTAKPVPVRPRPDLRGWVGEYIPGKGGDANLMIMFHGLGDTEKPFANLARTMGLPFTAVLVLRAPLAVPLMDTPSFMWYPGFDGMFNPLPPSAADPSSAVTRLRELLTSLMVTWALEDIHLFGFAQGGSLALSLSLSVADSPLGEARRLGSVVSVMGGIEGKVPTARSNTPVLYYTRKPANAEEQKVKERFSEVTVFRAPSNGGMPANMEEWRPVFGFWGKMLKRDESWKGGEVYEVVQ